MRGSEFESQAGDQMYVNNYYKITFATNRSIQVLSGMELMYGFYLGIQSIAIVIENPTEFQVFKYHMDKLE